MLVLLQSVVTPLLRVALGKEMETAPAAQTLSVSQEGGWQGRCQCLAVVCVFNGD